MPAYFYSREKALAFAKETPEGSLHGEVTGTMFFDLAKNYNVRDAMRKFDRPTLIVQGRQDPIGESTAYEIHLAIQGSSLEWIDESGHFPWIEQPDRFFRIVREFLSGR